VTDHHHTHAFFLPVILINGALSKGVFIFVRIGETSWDGGAGELQTG